MLAIRSLYVFQEVNIDRRYTFLEAVTDWRTLTYTFFCGLRWNKSVYVGVLISLWLFLIPLFLFAAQPTEFFLDVLKKLEQQRHKYVELRGKNM
jgi:hypothetical protein